MVGIAVAAVVAVMVWYFWPEIRAFVMDAVEDMENDDKRD